MREVALAVEASREDYAAACVRLFSQIWESLESLHTSGEPTQIAISAEIVRLDLILAVDACDSIQWRSWLTTAQRLSLRALLVGVIDALDAPAGDATAHSILQVQDRLFDIVLEYCRELRAGGAGLASEGEFLPLQEPQRARLRLHV